MDKETTDIKRVISTGSISDLTKVDTGDSLYGLAGAPTYSAVKMPDTLSEAISRASYTPVPPPLYTESMLPHIVRAKEEGVRQRIEMDTIVLDRGVAVSQGLDHADMILGLKVKYAKKESLPMDSAFILMKADKGLEEMEVSELQAEKRRLENELDKICEALIEKGVERVGGVKGTKGVEYDPRVAKKLKEVAESEAKEEKEFKGIEYTTLTPGKTFLIEASSKYSTISIRDGDLPSAVVITPSMIADFEMFTKPIGRSVPAGGVPKMPRGFDYATLKLRKEDGSTLTYKIVDEEEAGKIARFVEENRRVLPF